MLRHEQYGYSPCGQAVRPLVKSKVAPHVSAIVAPVCTSYRVDFSSSTWREVGRMNRSEFEALRVSLRAVAESAATAARSADGVTQPEQGEILVGSLRARYEIDHASAVVLVIGLQSSESDAPARTQPEPTGREETAPRR